MGLRDWFRPATTVGTIRTLLTPREAAHAARAFTFARVWTCTCGAQLKIRARDDRASGPSNYVAYLPGHPRAGHSRTPSESLTWDGLAAERGWLTTTSEAACPACQARLSMPDYKAAKRRGTL